MTPPEPDDDPTRALDDFVRRMRPAAAPPPATDDDLTSLTSLAGLQARLHPERGAGPARSRGGTLRSGQTWDADDVVDVTELRMPPMPTTPGDLPELRLPEVLAPLPMDTAALDAALQQASQRASAQFNAEDLAAAAPAWQPDLQALQLRRATDPRLLATWQPGAWTGAVREVMAPATEFVTTASGTAVESYPPHRLLLLWPPQRLDMPLLGRWPQRVQLSALPADTAADALLAQVPDAAPLWLLAGPEDVDWALAAEIVLHHEPALRPFQAQGLRHFIEGEREAGFARLNSRYRPAPGGAHLA